MRFWLQRKFILMKGIHCVLICLFNFFTLSSQDSCIIHSSLRSKCRKGIADREEEKKGGGLGREGKVPSLPFSPLSRFSPSPLRFLHLPQRLNLLMQAFYHLMIQSIQTHRNLAASSFLPFNISKS